MASFLVIFCKSGKDDFAPVAQVLDDFSVKGTRKMVHRKSPGFLFQVVDKFEKFFHEDEDSLSFVSGFISFKNTDVKTQGSIPADFNEIIRRQGDKCLENLEGTFAAFRYEKATHRLIFANDKFGVFPLFVFENAGFIILSNEYHPAACLSKQLNKEAVAEFLTLGVTIGNKTFFKDILNLAPATLAVATQNGVSFSTYWQPDITPVSSADIPALARKVLDGFTAINREYAESKIAEMCLLTAGADSRLIVSTLTPAQLAGMLFYTSNLSFLDPLQDKDVVGASAIAGKFHLKHIIEKISFFENNFGPDYFEKEREIRKSQVYGGWHGGEFLGGFFLKAAPIRSRLNFEEVDQKYKSVFNWWFRFRIKKHPFHSYMEELNRLKGNTMLFMIHQMTRSFFSNIYGGSRGHWVQPFQLMNHGFSPFWDSRFLQLILQVPLSALENYGFYNEVFKNVNKDFTDIPSNSPLTNREDSVLPPMTLGIEPKHQIPNTHHAAWEESLTKPEIWSRGFYNRKMLPEILRDEFGQTTRDWLDFEVWYSKYV